MKLSKMSKEEIELYSYVDLTKMILIEKKKPLNTPTIFKEICKLLGMSDEDYENKIGDFYTSLTTDKNFILLDNGKWDLRDHHPIEILLNEEDEEDEEIEEADNIEANAPIEDDLGDGDTDEGLEDNEELTIISEEELED